MNSLSSSISVRLIKRERCISQAKPSIQRTANYERLIHSSLLSQVINETSVYEREKKTAITHLHAVQGWWAVLLGNNLSRKIECYGRCIAQRAILVFFAYTPETNEILRTKKTSPSYLTFSRGVINSVITIWSKEILS